MHAPRRAAPLRLLLAALATALSASGLFALGSVVSISGASASMICGAGTIQYAYNGLCASFSGADGWYGSYGPGFPTSLGWVFASQPPTGTAPAPDPTQGYVAGAAPAGANISDADALGFAFSQAQATDAWQGGAQYSANDEAAAAVLLYDWVVWGTAVPATSGGVLSAFDALDAWYQEAVGATGSPTIDMNTTGIGPVPTAGAIYQVRLTFPGSGTSAPSFPITLSLVGGYFAGGSTTSVVSTDANGYASAEIYADSSSTDVNVTATAQVGSPRLNFYDPSSGGQPVVSFGAPVSSSNTETIRASTSETGTGTVSIDEGGDDVAYLGLAGGVYQVIDAQQTVVATLTTDSAGHAGPTQPLPLGTYTVHEQTAPAGYTAAADQTVNIVDGGNVAAHFTGANENQAIPATLTISDTDQQTGALLAGARFEVHYDPSGTGTYSQNLGSCMTGTSGSCSPAGNDGTALLPGDYQATETAAPAGYYLDVAAPPQLVALAPSANGVMHFFNMFLGSVQLQKSGNDAAYYGVAGATFRIAGPYPSNGTVGTLTVGVNSSSNVVGNMRPGTYTLAETRPPAGYAAVAPFPVAVALGHATTQVNVLDAIDPATLDIYNQVQGTTTPIVGGVFDVRYDSSNSGVYDTDLGRCTTDAIGACSPAASAGLGLLPGRYEVTQRSAPFGYLVDPVQPTRYVVLTPGAVALLDYHDPRLVSLSFAKVPTGNFNPQESDLAGAVYVVHMGTLAGATVATCTTGPLGTCSTPSSLVSGDSYCWVEISAPPGFAAGESGCLVTDDATGTVPIVVDEPGEFVAIAAVKVASGEPGRTLPGALLDLYRMDGASGPAAPPAPAASPSLSGGTWVASGTSDAAGKVTFPLQLPGYAYCVVEESPPFGFTLDLTPRCTAVLAGSPVVPATATTVTVPDSRAPLEVTPPPPMPPAHLAAPSTVVLSAHKYDELAPSNPIAGAAYDLYVVGPAPGRPASPPPTDPPPASLTGDSWVARATTDASGNLSFTVPSGYAWCLREAVAPAGFAFDPQAHCTSVLTTASPPAQAKIELPEHPLMVDLQAHKFNTFQPDTGIPGAVYDLYTVGGRAPGAAPPDQSVGAGVPGDSFYAQGVTGRGGLLVIAVPAGYSWCLKEAKAPPAYRFDPGLHCTATLDAKIAVASPQVALPELPKHLPNPPVPLPQLPFTGLAVEPILAAAAACAGAGGLLLRSGRRRRGESG